MPFNCGLSDLAFFAVQYNSLYFELTFSSFGSPSPSDFASKHIFVASVPVVDTGE
jgi:hypothetical protein